jgi:hypothetical protein
MSHSSKRYATIHNKLKKRKSSPMKHPIIGTTECNYSKGKESKKTNIGKNTTQAKITCCTTNGPKRTMVTQYMNALSHWRKKFATDSYFRFRVISRRYFRKLSSASDPSITGQSVRKVSWDSQIDVLIFDST